MGSELELQLARVNYPLTDRDRLLEERAYYQQHINKAEYEKYEVIEKLRDLEKAYASLLMKYSDLDEQYNDVMWQVHTSNLEYSNHVLE